MTTNAYQPETKWNADDQKLKFIMEIEGLLEQAFLDRDPEGIWDGLSAYRRQTLTKFNSATQGQINECFEILASRYKTYLENKSIDTFNNYYAYAEGVFLTISQKIKEAGIYFREGRDVSHAILQK